MPLAVTVLTAIGTFSRQIGLQLVILQFVISASRKAKKNTAGSSSALKGKFDIRLVKFTCDAFPPALLESLGVLLCLFLNGLY
jgi:hypothetical protein